MLLKCIALIKFECISSEIFQELIKGGVGIKAESWKIFQKLISGGGTIIRYLRVCLENLPISWWKLISEIDD